MFALNFEQYGEKFRKFIRRFLLSRYAENSKCVLIGKKLARNLEGLSYFKDLIYYILYISLFIGSI